MDDVIAEVVNVWVWLGSNLALRDVSLKIHAGRFIGLMGPNGGGKTTLLKAIVGLIKPDRGKVTVSGPVRKTIGYVPQEGYVDHEFPVTAYDVVEMGLHNSLRLPSQVSTDEKKQVMETLRLVGMEKLAARRIGTLSGGQKQRVFIARAIVAKPRLLLLDEPMTGVDADARDEFYRLLSILRRDLSLTIILASHDIEVIPNQADEIVCINQRVFVHAEPGEIGNAEQFRRAYGCELEFIAHGKYPHRIIEHHGDEDAND